MRSHTSSPKTPKRVLLTGATGFVGSHAYPALVAAGYDVVCASRDPAKAQRLHPERNWVRLDVEDADSIRNAVVGCDAALFLVHAMDTDDYPERERRGAALFREAAEGAGVRRVVYLGGVVPQTEFPSRHLQSRQQTGEILRAGSVSTIELRAAMVLGNGSASWHMVRDLAARLPAMVLPRWLRNRSHPVFIDDVVRGLIAALELPTTDSKCYAIPGAECVTHREMLDRTASIMGKRPMLWNVPVLSPRLSSYWIALVTRVPHKLARELVEGVRHDLLPTHCSLWDEISMTPVALDEAIRLCLRDDPQSWPSPFAVARMVSLGLDGSAGARL